MMRLTSIILVITILGSPTVSQAENGAGIDQSFSQTEASHFVSLAMKCIQKEYPNKLDHVNNDAEDVRSPRTMHPAFYGCFDWHSTVHGHWMLVHLLRLFPDMPEARQI